MNRTFVIADTHFGHKNIIKYENARSFQSIEEHDEELVRRWNDKVRKSDTVWHLGDVLFGKHSFDILKRLNGVKRLVMGNHDQYPAKLYLEHFNSIHGAAELRGHILTHVPVHPCQFHRFIGNVHGHLHHNVVEDERYFCVSVEHTDLSPVLIDEVINRR